MTMERKR